MRKILHVGDVGTEIATQVDGVELDAATVRKIKFQKPSGTIVVRDAVVDPLDVTVMYYTTEANFLDESGAWEAMGYVEFVNGKWHTTKFSFNVDAVYNES